MEEITAAAFKENYPSSDDYHYVQSSHRNYARYVFVKGQEYRLFTKNGDKFYKNGTTYYLSNAFFHLSREDVV